VAILLLQFITQLTNMPLQSIESLIANCNDAFPNTGIVAWLTLLSGDLANGLTYTANPATNQLTTATPHGLVNGSRIRLVGGTLPTPLLANTDYFAIVTNPTIISLATTLANAQAATAIDLTDAGVGTLTLTEQALTVADPLTVLINKEISHPSWPTRGEISNLGAAINIGGKAEKPVKQIPVSKTASIALNYQHYLVIESSSVSTGILGNIPATGTGYSLETAAGVQTIGVGDPPRVIFYKIRMQNT
jgi:hypothetical protein